MPDTPNTPKNIRDFLEALETPSKPLTKWEEGFLADITDYFDRRGRLTDGQFYTLEKIYTEKTD